MDKITVFILFMMIFLITTLLIFLLLGKQNYVIFKNRNNESRTNRIKSNDEIIRDYDMRKLYDPLEGPVQRGDRANIIPLYTKQVFDISTRGDKDTYRQVGILIATDNIEPNKIIKLFGRKEYPDSNNYEYYVELNNGNDNVKVPLSDIRKEIYNDDSVLVKQINRTYVASIYKNDYPRYIPNIL